MTIAVDLAKEVFEIAAAVPKGRIAQPLQQWALSLDDRRGHNKATCALANKPARIAWATGRHNRDFNGDFVSSPTTVH